MKIAPASCELEELIRSAGYEKAKFHLMKLVVKCALESLSHAESRMAQNWMQFCAKKGALCRASRSKAGVGLKKRLLRPQENAITNELGQYVEDYFKGLACNHPYRNVSFHFERPKNSTELAGSKQKRLDFQYEARFPQGPEFVIEAKPLFSEPDIKTKYLGETGLGRFLREKEPFSEGSLAALMGYVIETELVDWEGRVQGAIADDKRCESTVVIKPTAWRERLWSTLHSRPSGMKPIWMLHLLVTYPEVQGLVTKVG